MFNITNISRKKIEAKVEYEKDGISYLSRDEAKFISIETFNSFAKTDYKSVKDLIYTPLKFEDELKVRNTILNSSFVLTL